jgi:formyltetrahydrofolate hydrolase
MDFIEKNLPFIAKTITGLVVFVFTLGKIWQTYKQMSHDIVELRIKLKDVATKDKEEGQKLSMRVECLERESVSVDQFNNSFQKQAEKMELLFQKSMDHNETTLKMLNEKIERVLFHLLGKKGD